jgi:hypothetical protein
MDRSRHRLTAHLKSVLGKEAYLPWILNQSQPNVGPRRDFLSIFFKFPLDFILVLCRQERGVCPIRECAVPTRLRLSAWATSGPTHRASSIAVPSVAHVCERLGSMRRVHSLTHQRPLGIFDIKTRNFLSKSHHSKTLSPQRISRIIRTLRQHTLGIFDLCELRGSVRDNSFSCSLSVL